VAFAPPIVVDGPSSDIALGGLSVARDGSGGLVYVKGGRAFVSVLGGGVFAAPQALDTGLAGASSQPVVAAGNGGLLLAAFVNAGNLYVTTRTSSSAPWSAPQPLAAGVVNPVISITAFGKAYLAFTQNGAGGHDVRAAFYYRGAWALESAPLDAAPADDAGVGTGRPAVAAAGDGVGIVAWGEAGHVYTRRVWGTSPSVVFEQADVPALGTWNEVSADEPAVGVGGDSSYVDVVYHEVLRSGLAQQSRVLLGRLRGSQYDAATGADGLGTPGTEGADHPMIATDEYGRGFAVSQRTTSNELVAMLTGSNGAPGPIEQVDSLHNTGQAYGAPASAGLFDGLIAWQQDPGVSGQPEIRARFYDQNGAGPEMVISTPGQGQVDAARGLDAAGDISADVAVAWVQGDQIVAAQLYQPPGSFSAASRPRYVRTSRPVLSWSKPREQWPPLRYVVVLDGAQVGETVDVTRLAVALPDGPHRYSVTATNRAGLQSVSRSGTIWVDTVAPTLQVSLSGQYRAGAVLHLAADYSDQPAGTASGIASAIINWGDGTSTHARQRNGHAYSRPGRYAIVVTVTDRAGNRTQIERSVRIRAPQKRKGKHK
jgi:hypothetical protein